MLNPEEFIIDEKCFRYSPLMLTPARELYSIVFRQLGSVGASLLEAFKLSDDFKISMEDEINIEMLSKIFSSITNSIGSAIRELSLIIDAEWLKNIMDKKICPQLEIKNSLNNFIPITPDWYETNMQCSTEIALFLKVLSIQYIDFLSRWGKTKNTIEIIQKNIKNLMSQKH
jgi:hypothetical protein